MHIAHCLHPHPRNNGSGRTCANLTVEPPMFVMLATISPGFLGGGINQVRVYRWFRVSANCPFLQWRASSASAPRIGFQTWSSRFKTYLEAVHAPPSPLSELALTPSLLWAPRSSFTTSVLEFPTCRRAAVPLSEFVHVDCGTGQHIRVRSACT